MIKIHQYCVNKNTGSTIELNSSKREGKYIVEKFVRGKVTPIKRSVIAKFDDIESAMKKIKSLKSGNGWSEMKQI